MLNRLCFFFRSKTPLLLFFVRTNRRIGESTEDFEMQCKKLTFELEELQVWWVAYLQIVWWKTRGENVGGCHE